MATAIVLKQPFVTTVVIGRCGGAARNRLGRRTPVTVRLRTDGNGVATDGVASLLFGLPPELERGMAAVGCQHPDSCP